MGHIKDRWTVKRGGERVPSERYGKGLRWQVWVSVHGEPKCGGSFRTKDMAQRKLIELEADAARGQWVDPGNRTLVGDVVRNYAATRHHRRRTAERFDSLIRVHVEPLPLGARRAATVRPSEAQAWVSDRAQVLAPTTLRVLVGIVRSAFNAAVLDRIVGANPFQQVTLPPVERERIVPLTVQQVCAIRDEVAERYRAMVITQAGLGLRLGEMLALRDCDIDFLRRTVRVQDQIDRKTRERVPPKTPRSRRTVPLPDFVGEAVARHMTTRAPGPGGLLFYTQTNRPVQHDWYANRVFVRAVARVQDRIEKDRADAKRQGVTPPLPLAANVTTHDLRHHYASVLLASGQSVVAVAELLGHENATLVLNTYGHLLPGGDDIARRAMEMAWSENSGPRAALATTPSRPKPG